MNDQAELFKVTRGSLLTFAASILRNQEDAQDVVQEVFRECLEIDQQKVTRPYLFKAVRNRSLNKKRSTVRLINALERFADYLQILEEEVENDDVTVMDLVQKLPEKQKEVLLLRIKAELKISEIAEVLNIPEGTVKSRVNKGLKFLRAHVEGR